MAVRRFNYTGRKRILRKDISIIIHEDSAAVSFDLKKLNLGDYGFPNDAVIYVEAYRQTDLMRFDAGTAGSPQFLADKVLAEFDTAAVVRFRIKVISLDGERGLLIGLADKLRPVRPDIEEDNRKPLLDVQLSKSLGEQIFRIDFVRVPILLINQKVGDWRALARSPAFTSLVLPSVLREILIRAIFREEIRDMDDTSHWGTQWLKFARSLPGMHELPEKTEDREADNDSWDDWVDDAVDAFCRFERLFKYLRLYFAEEAIA